MTQNATTQNTRLGVWLMIATTNVFAAQDGLSRHLGALYPVEMVVMIRFWFFALFVLAMAARSPGGLRAAAVTRMALRMISTLEEVNEQSGLELEIRIGINSGPVVAMSLVSSAVTCA